MNPVSLFARDTTPIRKLLALKAVAGEPINEYTATGNPVTFSTNVAKPLKSILIPWTPSQSGSGDPSPENVRPITGWTGLNIYRTGINAFDGILEPGMLDGNGQNTGNSNFRSKNFIPVIPGGKYRPVFNIAGGGSNMNVFYYYKDKTRKRDAWAAPTSTLTIDTDVCFVRFYMDSAWSAATDRTIGFNYSATATEFVPYAGGTTYPVTFPALGKNLLNPATLEQGGIGLNGNETIASNRIRTDFIPVEAGEKYTVSATGFIGFMHFYNANKESISENVGGVNITAPENAKFVRCGFRKSDNVDIVPSDIVDGQFEEGSTATAYEPYTNTVYGGSLDLTTGGLTVDMVCYTGGWTQYDQKNGYKKYQRQNVLLSDTTNVFNKSNMVTKFDIVQSNPNDNRIQPPKQGSTSVNMYMSLDENYNADDVQYCYRIAEPYTVQLTPTEITALIGENVVWTDTNGSNTAVYFKRG